MLSSMKKKKSNIKNLNLCKTGSKIGQVRLIAKYIVIQIKNETMTVKYKGLKKK